MFIFLRYIGESLNRILKGKGRFN